MKCKLLFPSFNVEHLLNFPMRRIRCYLNFDVMLLEAYKLLSWVWGIWLHRQSINKSSYLQKLICYLWKCYMVSAKMKLALTCLLCQRHYFHDKNRSRRYVGWIFYDIIIVEILLVSFFVLHHWLPIKYKYIFKKSFSKQDRCHGSILMNVELL